MQREFSAGGVLVRRLGGRWMLAAIRPQGKPAGIWALPKGRIDQGEPGEQESPEAAALREVAEETGAHGRSLGKLGDVKYVYTWPPKPAAGERIFKVVSFFLVRYEGGRLGDLPEEFRHEVAEVKWLPLEEAPRLLAYGGEKDMARKALEVLSEDV
jgi:8-oxo-dGTP pyrophosphatase MutT (NUDIX family)